MPLAELRKRPARASRRRAGPARARRRERERERERGRGRGRSAGGASAAAAARGYRRDGAPVFTVPVGSTADIQDVAIIDVYTSGLVAKKDTGGGQPERDGGVLPWDAAAG